MSHIIVEAYKKLKPEYKEIVDKVVDKASKNPNIEYQVILLPILLYGEQERKLLSNSLERIREKIEESLNKELFMRYIRRRKIIIG